MAPDRGLSAAAAPPQRRPASIGAVRLADGGVGRLLEDVRVRRQARCQARPAERHARGAWSAGRHPRAVSAAEAARRPGGPRCFEGGDDARPLSGAAGPAGTDGAAAQGRSGGPRLPPALGDGPVADGPRLDVPGGVPSIVLARASSPREQEEAGQRPELRRSPSSSREAPGAALGVRRSLSKGSTGSFSDLRRSASKEEAGSLARLRRQSTREGPAAPADAGAPALPRSSSQGARAPRRSDAAAPSYGDGDLIGFLQGVSRAGKGLTNHDVKVMREILQGSSPAAVAVVDPAFGWTPLLLAADQGSVPALSLLLGAGAALGHRCARGNTALHVAARGGQLPAVQLLVGRRADLDARSEIGWTPLTWACSGGWDQVVRALLEAEADVEAADHHGRTPAMWAARHGHASAVCTLLGEGFDLTARDTAGLGVAEHAGERLDLRAAIVAAGRTSEALLEAARRHRLEDVESALERRALVDARDEEDMTPLEWAVAHGSLDLLRMLIRHGARPAVDACKVASAELLLGSREPLSGALLDRALAMSDGLLAAAREGDWDATREHVLNGACVHVREKETLRSPLMWAVLWGRADVVDFLADARARLDQRDCLGWTAVHHAVCHDQVEILSALHFLGADTSALTHEGDSPLHTASRAGGAGAVLLLAAAGADVDARGGTEGLAPAQLAVQEGSLGVLWSLAACGAELGVRDCEGRSLLALAALRGHAEVVRALLGPPELPAALPQAARVEPGGVPRRAPGGGGGGGAPGRCGAGGAAREGRPKRPSGASQESPTGRRVTLLVGEAEQPAAAPRPAAQSLRPPSPPQRPRAPVARGRAAGSPKASPTASPRSPGAAPEAAEEGVEAWCERWGRLGLLAKAQALRAAAADAAGAGAPLAPGASLREQDDGGLAPLALAVLGGKVEVVAVLLEQKAPVDAADKQGLTALMLAAARGDLPAVERLLAAGASRSLRSLGGQCAVDLAAGAEVRSLLERLDLLGRLPPEGQAPPRRSMLVEAAAEEQPGRPVTAPASFRVRVEELPKSLSAEVTEAVIIRLLRQRTTGKPTRIEVPVDPVTSRPKGHAWLEFDNSRKAHACVSSSQDGTVLGQRVRWVWESEPPRDLAGTRLQPSEAASSGGRTPQSRGAGGAWARGWARQAPCDLRDFRQPSGDLSDAGPSKHQSSESVHQGGAGSGGLSRQRTRDLGDLEGGAAPGEAPRGSELVLSGASEAPPRASGAARVQPVHPKVLRRAMAEGDAESLDACRKPREFKVSRAIAERRVRASR